MKEKDLSKFLIKVKACDAACLWYAANKKGKTYKQLVFKLLDEGKFQWINWIFCQVFLKRQKIMYAIYCAEQVIDIFEKKYKDDKRPREAVEAAKRCVEKSNVKNKNIAKAANKAAAAVSAISYGDAVAYAAYAIHCAAHAAAYVGSNSVFGKNAPYSAGKAAAYAATEDKKTLKKIIKYGMTLV